MYSNQQTKGPWIFLWNKFTSKLTRKPSFWQNYKNKQMVVDQENITNTVCFIVNFCTLITLHWEFFPVTTDSYLPRVTK